MNIKKEGDKFVLYSRDGTRKLYKSQSYQQCVNKQKEIEGFKAKQKEKNVSKKV